MGIGVGLKVGQITCGTGVPFAVKKDAFVDLLVERHTGVAVGRVEGGIEAVGAPLRSQSAVSVGATESGVDYHFLQPSAVVLFDVGGKGVVAFALGE